MAKTWEERERNGGVGSSFSIRSHCSPNDSKSANGIELDTLAAVAMSPSNKNKRMHPTGVEASTQ